MDNRPTGTITFLFTDIEGSTVLLERIGSERYAEILGDHQRLLREAFAAHGGTEVRTEGDSYFVAFHSAAEGVAAALAGQQALGGHPWPDGVAIRVRMGLHTGEAILSADDYQGQAVHEAARICQVAHGEQVLLSRTTADLLGPMLPVGASMRALGDHRLKDLSRPTTLFQLLHTDLPDHFPRLRSMEALPNNLPVQLTPFIGREAELDETKHMIASTRIMTLTGAGGCGKTRLALQAAADLLEGFPDGVWLAELAPLTDPVLVERTVAAAIGARDEPGRRLIDTLSDAIGHKRMLLILDNCEHLLHACAELAVELVRACPNLHLLASSREGLAVDGEVVWRVPSLQVPDPRAKDSVEALLRYESVRLFLDRAGAALPGFQLDEASAPALAQICHRLDGIPLALELAAARVRVLSIPQINERLHDRFRLLTGGRRGALPRQRTLHALVDWSYDLLGPIEQLLLRHLSVFAGGFDLDAAESVCADDTLDAADVLDVLTALVDKSIVQVEESDGRARYRLLETIREYAEEKLGAAEDPEAVRARHCARYLALGEQAEAGLEGPEQAAWLHQLELEHDNLRAALHWTLSVDDGADAALRIARSLWRFWLVRGYVGEGRGWLDAALRTRGEAVPDIRARAYRAAGALALAHHDLSAARDLFESSLALEREHGDDDGVAVTLNNLGLVAQNQGDFARARELHEESLAITRRTGRVHVTSATLHNLGLIALIQGDHAAARPHLEESLLFERRRGDLEAIARCLTNLANVALEEQQTAEANAHIEEALEIRRTIGDRRGIAGSLIALARTFIQAGDASAGRPLILEAAVLSGEVEWHQGRAMALENLAEISLAEGDHVRALTLLTASDRLRSSIDTPRRGVAAEMHQRALDELRAGLGPDASEAERMARSMDFDAALELGSKPPEGRAESADAEPPADASAPQMHREGEIWTVRWGGTTARVRDTKGMGYLARLVGSPRLEFHALDLAGAPSEVGGNAGPVLDEKAKRSYKERLEDLLEQKADAEQIGDAGQVERLRDEVEQIEKELRTATGLGGRDRKAADVAERARVNITKAIKTAIDKIADAHAELGMHLRAAVRTGTFCAYAPDRDRG